MPYKTCLIYMPILSDYKLAVAYFQLFHVSPDEKPTGVACPICGKLLRWAKNLPSHMRMHEGKYPYHCSVCDKGFTSTTRHRDHMEKVHGQMPRFILPALPESHMEATD